MTTTAESMAGSSLHPPATRTGWFATPWRLGLTRGEALIYGVILIAAAVLRLWDLGGRVLHHDEAIHAKEVYDMLHGQQYAYDPAYHGPLLYFALTPLFFFFGDSDGMARVMPALVGIGSIVAIPLYRPLLGRVGTPLAMLVFTVSTANLYYARSLRHDMFLAAALIVLGGAVVRYLSEPRRKWLIVAWVAFALAFVTKEDTYIHGFILVVALVLFVAVTVLTRNRRPESLPMPLRQIRSAVHGLRRDPNGVVYGLLIFLAVAFVLYTSFFTNFVGFRDGFVKAIEYWRGVHTTERVNQPWFYYAMFMAVYEPFVLIFGTVALVRVWKAHHAGAYVLALWTVIGLGVYSIAGEKAAWLVVPAMWPLALLACWWVGRQFDRPGARWVRALVLVGTVVTLAWTVRFAIPTNFERGDKPIDFVIYVQTTPDVRVAAEVVDEAVRRDGGDTQTRFLVENEFAWPFAWYLRHYTRVHYGTAEAENIMDAPVLIVSPATADRIGVQLTDYVGRRMRLRWWFPEFAYKAWTWGAFGAFFNDPEAQRTFWSWLFVREATPVPLGTYDFMLYLRTDLLGAGPIGPFTPVGGDPSG